MLIALPVEALIKELLGKGDSTTTTRNRKPFVRQMRFGRLSVTKRINKPWEIISAYGV
jgi:hypothetical protein